MISRSRTSVLSHAAILRVGAVAAVLLALWIAVLWAVGVP